MVHQWFVLLPYSKKVTCSISGGDDGFSMYVLQVQQYAV